MNQQICQVKYLTTCDQVAWSLDKSNQIGSPNAILKHGSSNKQSIVWFEYLSMNRIPEIVQLLEMYQKQQNTVKKLGKDMFLLEGSTRLNYYTPIKMVTKEVLAIRKQEDSMYIVHFYQPSEEGIITYKNKWMNFVEEFTTFGNKSIYKSVISYDKNQSKVFQALSNKFLSDRLEKAVKVLGSLPSLHLINIQEVQSEIAITPITHISKSSRPTTPSVKSDPSFNQQHLRLPNLSNQQKKIFCKMQEQFPTATDNELCRFLHAQSYNLQKSITQYSKYLTWKKEAIQKYTMDSFKQITDKRMFIYCGKDKKGRPVIFNQAAAVIPSQLNQDLYCEFYRYYLQIYIPSKMSGYVDQIMILVNGKGLGMKNFKISLTKRNMNQMLAIAPQRQAKLVAVNANWFGTTVWAILQPLLPAKSASKIAVYGSKKDDYIVHLQELMDRCVIPQVMGGDNKLPNNY